MGLQILEVKDNTFNVSPHPAGWLLINAVGTNAQAEVSGGISASGLFFHGAYLAWTLSDRRSKDELCSKRECGPPATIRNSWLSFGTKKAGDE